MEYTYEVVHCKTEEEWKIVQSIINYEFLSPYNKNDCINFKEHMRAQLSYYQEYNSKILSFEEFDKLLNLGYSDFENENVKTKQT